MISQDVWKTLYINQKERTKKKLNLKGKTKHTWLVLQEKITNKLKIVRFYLRAIFQTSVKQLSFEFQWYIYPETFL